MAQAGLARCGRSTMSVFHVRSTSNFYGSGERNHGHWYGFSNNPWHACHPSPPAMGTGHL